MPNPERVLARAAASAVMALACLVLQTRHAVPGEPADGQNSAGLFNPLPPTGDPDRLGAIWFRQGEFLRSLAFSPDGRTLATAGSAPVVHLWDVPSGKELAQIAGPDPEDWALRFSPDGKRLAIAGTSVRIHDLSAGKLLWKNELPGGFEAHSVVFSPDGRLVAAPGGNEHGRAQGETVLVKVWDAATGDLKQTCAYPAKVGGWGVTSLAFSPDGRWLAASGNHAGVRMWDVSTGEEIRAFGENIDLFYCVAFSPSGSLLAAGDSDGVISLWEPQTARPIGRLRAPAVDPMIGFGRRPAPDFGPGFGGGRRFRAPDAPEVRWLSFTPSGTTLVAAGYDWRVQLWDVPSGHPIGGFPLRGRYWDQSLAIALAPDGWIAESSGRFGIVRVYDLVSAAPLLAQAPIDKLWGDLASSDIFVARRAAVAFVDRANVAVPFFAKRLNPAAPTDTSKYEPLLAQLDSDRFDKRQQAEAQLRQIGNAAEPALRKLLAGKFSAEARARAERLLEAINPVGVLALDTDERQSIQAARVLAEIGTPDARTLLERLASGAPEAPQTAEAKSLLQRIAPSR